MDHGHGGLAWLQPAHLKHASSMADCGYANVLPQPGSSFSLHCHIAPYEVDHPVCLRGGHLSVLGSQLDSILGG